MLLWDILGASVGISTRTPYCSTVCLCLNNSLTHSKTIGNPPSPEACLHIRLPMCLPRNIWNLVYGMRMR